MELSAKLLHDVEFKERWRGYDPDEVDAFLEQVARGIEALQEQVRDVERGARRRSGSAPAEAPASAESVSDEELRRVLVMAQRTADTAVREATDEAGRLVAEGKVRAAELTTEADRYSAATRTDADEYSSVTRQAADEYASVTRAEADEYGAATRQAADDYAVEVRALADDQVAARVARAEAEVEEATAGARRRAREEVEALEARRDQLTLEVADGDSRLFEQRARAEGIIAELHRLIEGPLGVAAPVAPMVSMAVATTTLADEEALDDLDGASDELVDDELVDDEVASAEEYAELLTESLSEPAWAGGDDDEGDDDDLEATDATGELEVDELDDGELDDEELDDEVAWADELDDEPDDEELDEEEVVVDLAETATRPASLDESVVRTGELSLGDLGRPASLWDDAGGPPTQAMPATVAAEGSDEDAELAELRRAIDEDELSPAAEAFFSQAAYEDDRWKGLRRRGR